MVLKNYKIKFKDSLKKYKKINLRLKIFRYELLYWKINARKERMNMERKHCFAKPIVKRTKPLISSFLDFSKEQTTKKSDGNALEPYIKCDKFIDYWNELASQSNIIPICKKVKNNGDYCKSYIKGLKFFYYMKTGELFSNPNTFFFTRNYIDDLEKAYTPKVKTRDETIFRYIRQVAAVCENTKRRVPKSFGELIYTSFTARAQTYGSGVSFFLECLKEDANTNLIIQRDLDRLSKEDMYILEEYLLPLYQKIRGIDYLPEDSEMAAILHGIWTLKNLWKRDMKTFCENSFYAKKGRINPTFFWFVSLFCEFSEDIEWKDLPASYLFKTSKGPLHEFIDTLRQRL